MSGVRDRYYDPKIGRYITSDPIGLQGGINTFGYVDGNPLTFMDKYGLAKDSITSRIETQILRNDSKGLKDLIDSGVLNPRQAKLAKEGLNKTNKINHIFNNPRHKLDGFLNKFKNKSDAFDELLNSTKNTINTGKSGKFEEVVSCRGTNITVRGSIVDGEVKIGTAFIP